jgi:hypothetical protein
MAERHDMASKARTFVIPRTMGPSDAPEVHAALMAWLDGRPKTATLELSEGDETLSPLALQLLVATARSETVPEVSFGEAARAALADVATPKAMETTPQ